MSLQPAEERPGAPLVLTVAEAAERVGVSDWLVYRLIREGRFPHRRLGGWIVIPVHALERWIDESEENAL